MAIFGTDNAYVNNLPTLEVFQGDTFTIAFEFEYPDGTPIDLRNNIDVILRISPFRDYNNPIIVKNGLVSTTQSNLCYMVFRSSDTRDITAIKCDYQPRLVVSNSGELDSYIRGEGSIFFNPEIY